MTSQKQSIELNSLFLDLQEEMKARLITNRKHILHPGSKGDATEMDWFNMFKNHFPKRYEIDKAFVIDYNGNLSQQIDIVIFDNQYSPFILKREGVNYVPAESVYAVIEAKQEITADYLAYASIKAESVRCLHRTSVLIPHAGGTFKAKKPHRIISGIVALENTWSPPYGTAFKKLMKSFEPKFQIDIGCALNAGSFEASYQSNKIKYEFSNTDNSLIFFFLRLLRKLQKIGTVTAIDILKYMESLK